MSTSFVFLIIFAPTVLGAGESPNGGLEDLRFHTRKIDETTTTKAPVINTISTEKFSPKFRHPSKMYTMAVKAAGSSVRFKCKATGNPSPNITWYKDSKPITRHLIPPTYGKWSIILDEVVKSDQGNYTCIVCNELGCINHTVDLNVPDRLFTAPFIKEQLKNVTASCNETVSFSCDFISELKTYVFWTWRSPNATEELKITSDDPNDQPERITKTNVTANSEGWYKCFAINALGTESSQAYLQVVNNNRK